MSVIIQNPLYIGKLKTKDGIFDAEHEPIVDEMTWNSAQIRYKEVSKKYGENWKNPFMGKHLLSGIIFCGNCGARYFVGSNRNKKYGFYSYYKCYSRDGNSKMKKIDHCKNPTWRVEKLDEIVKNEILSLDFEEIPQKRPSKVQKDPIKEIDKQISKLIDLYQVGGINIEEISAKIKVLDDKKKKLLSKTPTVENKLDLDNALSIKAKAEKIFSTGELSAQKAIVDALIKRIIIEEDGITIEWTFT